MAELPNLDAQHLFVHSTISKDRTEGRKQDDEEALKSLLKTSSATFKIGRRRGLPFKPGSKSNSSRSSSAEPVYMEVGKPPSLQRSRSPIRWRQDLELRQSSMPQAYEQTDRGVNDECSVSESAVFNGLSKDKDEMKKVGLHEAMQEKVRL
jgi:hypothetical protein